MTNSPYSSGNEEMDENMVQRSVRAHSYNSDSEESEDGIKREEYAGLKEQVYNDKLTALNDQFQQLQDGTHPEYRRHMKKVDQAHKERLRMSEMWMQIELEKVETEYILEKKLAAREFEEKKTELKENLLVELAEKKEKIEQERYSLDLNGDSMEYKGASTRKLRRRGAEPAPAIEKRRKPVTTTLQLLLDEREIDEDLRAIAKGRVQPTTPKHKAGVPSSPGGPGLDGHSNEPRIENGKLYFEKKWFHKGQPVMVECKDGSRFNAILACTDSNGILVRKACDNSRLKISLAQLAHGKYLVRRRTNSSVPGQSH